MRFFSNFSSAGKNLLRYQSEKVFVVSKSVSTSSGNASVGVSSSDWKDLVSNLFHTPDPNQIKVFYSKDLGLKSGDNLCNALSNLLSNHPYPILFVEPGEYILSGNPYGWGRIITVDYLLSLGLQRSFDWTIVYPYFDTHKMDYSYTLAPGAYTKFIIRDFAAPISLFGGCIDVTESSWDGYVEASGTSILAFGSEVSNSSRLTLIGGTIFYNDYSEINLPFFELENCRFVNNCGRANYIKLGQVWGSLNVWFWDFARNLEIEGIDVTSSIFLPSLSYLKTKWLFVAESLVIPYSSNVQIEVERQIRVSNLIVTDCGLELTYTGTYWGGYIGQIIFTVPSPLVINVPSENSAITIGKIIGASSYTKNGDGQVTILS